MLRLTHRQFDGVGKLLFRGFLGGRLGRLRRCDQSAFGTPGPRLRQTFLLFQECLSLSVGREPELTETGVVRRKCRLIFSLRVLDLRYDAIVLLHSLRLGASVPISHFRLSASVLVPCLLELIIHACKYLFGRDPSVLPVRPRRSRLSIGVKRSLAVPGVPS